MVANGSDVAMPGLPIVAPKTTDLAQSVGLKRFLPRFPRFSQVTVDVGDTSLFRD